MYRRRHRRHHRCRYTIVRRSAWKGRQDRIEKLSRQNDDLEVVVRRLERILERGGIAIQRWRRMRRVQLEKEHRALMQERQKYGFVSNAELRSLNRRLHQLDVCYNNLVRRSSK